MLRSFYAHFGSPAVIKRPSTVTDFDFIVMAYYGSWHLIICFLLLQSYTDVVSLILNVLVRQSWLEWPFVFLVSTLDSGCKVDSNADRTQELAVHELSLRSGCKSKSISE